MSGDAWSPEQYARFAKERAQPFHDLVAMIEKMPGMRVVDLGCGPGPLTKELHEALGARETSGVDSSPAMLAKASKVNAVGLRFELGDLAAFNAGGEHDGAFDLVFSNAAVHWANDHQAVLARFFRALAPGGQLAVQMPANHDTATHTVAAEVAATMGLRPRVSPVRDPETYARMLHRLGPSRQRVHLEVYPHVLGSRDDVIEWVKGTTLTDYQAQTTPERFAEFVARYREALFAVLPDERPFFYPFKRVFLWARR